MTAVTPRESRRRRDDLVRRLARADGTVGVFDEVSAGLRRLVPFDSAAWMTVDPGTGMPTGPTLVEDLPPVTSEQCSEHWRREFIDADVNRFDALVGATRPAAGLRAVAGDPYRSPRYRRFVQPLGFHDELRAVLRVGETPWGALTLWRRAGRPAFTARETDLIAGLSDPIGEALRVRTRPTEALGGLVRHDRPGMMLFDGAGDLVSLNRQARAWLAELPPDESLDTDLGVPVPLWLVITVFRAGTVVHGSGDGTARARVQSRRGPWLVCHASCLDAEAGASATVAVVIEPAKPAEIAPIIIDAYDLSHREQQITRSIARGAGTTEIAREIHLSPHTVRDHIKTIFAKAEVSSRGELVAKLFAEYYEPAYADHVVRVLGADRS
ncbi:MAG: LuxR C-terminal-related transcriptional regulator [Acidimicrobiales bacterium]